MKRVKVTLAFEEELLQAARAVAAKRKTSVNEMVRQYLQQIVEEDRRKAAWDRIKGLLEKASVVIEDSRPGREKPPAQRAGRT